jgi:3-isopropylmalate dehydratase small subunit
MTTLCYRNSINISLPVAEREDIFGNAVENDELIVDLEGVVIKNKIIHITLIPHLY